MYSSKIEGENIDYDCFFKHRFLNIKFNTDYTKKADDLFAAYEFITKNRLTLENLQKAHTILSANLLPKTHQGIIRTNPMFVFNSDDRIDYVAADPNVVNTEICKLFNDIDYLLKIVVSSMDIYQHVIKEILAGIDHIGRVESHFVMSEIKNSTALPV